MNLSVVVSSYGRFDHIKRLIASVHDSSEGKGEDTEVVAVCSDPPDSPKIQWLRQQPNVRLIEADVRTGPRLRSLYYYENLGIKASNGEWIFVTNDDTLLDPYFQMVLTKHGEFFDVMAVKGHLAEPGLGQRFPAIGTRRRPGEDKDSPLYLYDFTVIRRWVYEGIGYLDENIDWFGKGWDLALKCEFLARPRTCYDSSLFVNHTITPEGRNPPPCGGDFTYIQNKWDAWCKAHPGYAYTCPW